MEFLVDTAVTLTLGHTAYPKVADKLNKALIFTVAFASDPKFTVVPSYVFLPVGGMNAMDAYHSSEGALDVESADAVYDAASKKLTFTINPTNKFFDVDGDTYLLICGVSPDISPVTPMPDTDNGDAIPIIPTANFTTSADIEQDTTKTPSTGWPSITISITLPDGTRPAAGTVFYIWINIISRLNVAANLAEDVGPYTFTTNEEGKLVIDTSKLTGFPGGTCKITYKSKDGTLSGQTDEVKLAAAAPKTTTGGGGGGGCDAGFGALAIALMASISLRKR